MLCTRATYASIGRSFYPRVRDSNSCFYSPYFSNCRVPLSDLLQQRLPRGQLGDRHGLARGGHGLADRQGLGALHPRHVLGGLHGQLARDMVRQREALHPEQPGPCGGS